MAKKAQPSAKKVAAKKQAKKAKRPGAARKPRISTPGLFSPAVCEAIITYMLDGKSLRTISEQPGMPASQTVCAWVARGQLRAAEYPEYAAFAASYREAAVARAEMMSIEVLEIADTPQIGIKTVVKPLGTEITSGDMIEHRRLQVDTRKWLMTKFNPDKFADRTKQEITGPGGGPVKHEINMGATTEEAARAYDAITKGT